MKRRPEPAAIDRPRLALRDLIGQRACDRVLQQALVGLESLPIDPHHLRPVKIQRHYRHQDKYAENDVEDLDAFGADALHEFDADGLAGAGRTLPACVRADRSNRSR